MRSQVQLSLRMLKSKVQINLMLNILKVILELDA